MEEQTNTPSENPLSSTVMDLLDLITRYRKFLVRSIVLCAVVVTRRCTISSKMVQGDCISFSC